MTLYDAIDWACGIIAIGALVLAAATLVITAFIGPHNGQDE